MQNNLRLILVLIIVGLAFAGFKILSSGKLNLKSLRAINNRKEQEVNSVGGINGTTSNIDAQVKPQTQAEISNALNAINYKEKIAAFVLEDAVISESDAQKIIEKKPTFTLIKRNLGAAAINIVDPGCTVNPEDIVAINVIFKRKEGVSGKILYLALSSLNLQFSTTGIFHRLEKIKQEPQVQFSMASIKEPGTFDLDLFFETNFKGVVFFMTLSSPNSPLFAFEEMLSCARKLGHKVMGELCDSEYKKLSHQTLEFYREKVRNKQRLKTFAQKSEFIELPL